MVALSSRLEQANKIKLEFKYDYQGRRFEKKSYTWNTGTSSWDLDKTLRFAYDGYLQIANFDVGASTTLNQSFLWSGMQPLTMKDHASSVYYLYIHDGNKNVTNLIKASDASTVAEYEYDPFGRTIISNGTLADSNPFRFSSEYADDETKLVYYNYRYYNPDTGRWLSRDPIEESGGYNIYGMVYNNPISLNDFLGRDILPTRDADGTYTLKGPFWDWVSDKIFGTAEYVRGYQERGATNGITGYHRDLAHIAKDVYEKHSKLNGTGRWRRLDDNDLKDLKLGKAKFEESASGFFAALYQKGEKADSPPCEYVLAFRGTGGLFETDSWRPNKDWDKGNAQGFGIITEQYAAALKLGRLIKKSKVGENFNITGHSLGGGTCKCCFY